MIIKCANCGNVKHFFGDWGYWYDNFFCCSYKCMRAMRARDMEEEDMKMMTEAEKDRIRELRGQGMSYAQISVKLGGSVNDKTIGAFCRRENMGGRKPVNRPEAQTVEEAVAVIEKTVQQADEQTVDTARLINALCAAIELLQKLYAAKG